MSETHEKHVGSLIQSERGQVMMLVLLLLLVGGLFITPLFSLMTTGIRAGKSNERLMGRLYAADAGAENGLWKIRTNIDLPTYGNPKPSYSIADVNGKQVSVQIEYIWLLAGLEDPKNGEQPHAELVALGRVADNTTGLYEVQATYNVPGNVTVERVGVWLPNGFSYVPNSAILNTDNVTSNPGNPTQKFIAGGTALIWDVDLHLRFNVTSSLFFNYLPVGQEPENNFAWVRTTRNDVYLAWNGNISRYRITAIANDITAPGRQTEIKSSVLRNSAGTLRIGTWGITVR